MRSPSATLLLLPRTKSVGFLVGAMLTLLLGWAATPSPAAAPASYTNVVLIMADDFGYECSEV